MRVCLLFLISFSLCFGANEKEITKKISQNQNTLEYKKRQEKQINAKLQELGNAINLQKEENKMGWKSFSRIAKETSLRIKSIISNSICFRV